MGIIDIIFDISHFVYWFIIFYLSEYFVDTIILRWTQPMGGYIHLLEFLNFGLFGSETNLESYNYCLNLESKTCFPKLLWKINIHGHERVLLFDCNFIFSIEVHNDGKGFRHALMISSFKVLFMVSICALWLMSC